MQWARVKYILFIAFCSQELELVGFETGRFQLTTISPLHTTVHCLSLPDLSIHLYLLHRGLGMSFYQMKDEVYILISVTLMKTWLGASWLWVTQQKQIDMIKGQINLVKLKVNEIKGMNQIYHKVMGSTKTNTATNMEKEHDIKSSLTTCALNNYTPARNIVKDNKNTRLTASSGSPGNILRSGSSSSWRQSLQRGGACWKMRKNCST